MNKVIGSLLLLSFSTGIFADSPVNVPARLWSLAQYEEYWRVCSTPIVTMNKKHELIIIQSAACRQILGLK